MQENKYITFIDNSGRCIFAALTSDDKTLIKVKNPVMITVQQQQTGQMAVQLFPLFFQEFVKPTAENGTRENYFTFDKSTIAIGSDFNVDPRIIEQYERVTNPILVPTNTEEPEVIKLFDE